MVGPVKVRFIGKGSRGRESRVGKLIINSKEPTQAQASKARDKMRAEVNMATEPTELTGKVVNGVVVLDEPGRLEDGTTVRVRPFEKNSEARAKDINSLREMLLSHAGVIEDADLPTDLAENLDHYLYGTPKR
jgi:hypothetical protein